MSTVVAALILIATAALLLVSFTGIISGSSEQVEDPPNLSESLDGGGETGGSCEYKCVPEADTDQYCETIYEDQECVEEGQVCCEVIVE